MLIVGTRFLMLIVRTIAELNYLLTTTVRNLVPLAELPYIQNFFFFWPYVQKKNSSLTPFEKKIPKWPTFIFGFFFFFLSFSPFPPFQMAGLNVCLTRVQPSQAEVIGRFVFKNFFCSRRFDWRDWLFFSFFLAQHLYILKKMINKN